MSDLECDHCGKTFEGPEWRFNMKNLKLILMISVGIIFIVDIYFFLNDLQDVALIFVWCTFFYYLFTKEYLQKVNDHLKSISDSLEELNND